MVSSETPKWEASSVARTRLSRPRASRIWVRRSALSMGVEGLTVVFGKARAVARFFLTYGRQGGYCAACCTIRQDSGVEMVRRDGVGVTLGAEWIACCTLRTGRI